MRKLDKIQVFQVSTGFFGAFDCAAVQTLLLALKCRDVNTYFHSMRVSGLASEMGSILGLSARSLEELAIAGLLHDIGKIGLPDSVLQKSGRLSKSERGVVTQHPELSASIIAPLPGFERVREIIVQHHERFDGSGYPGIRKSDGIMMEARVLTIADAFDAMVSERPYRDPLSSREALAQIEREVGTQFCPVGFQALLEVFREGQRLEPGRQREIRTGIDSLVTTLGTPKSLTLCL